jgi:cytochrome c oxidase subunit 3
MEIPYTITARPDTGLSNGKLGIWLFLASEVMLFGALFTAYLFMRLGAEDGTWPTHIQNVWLGLTNTIVLIISSITMVWAWVALKERKFNTYRLALAITIFCGLVFLFIKGIEYNSKFNHTGLFIKAEAMDKYLPELKKMNAFYSEIPSQHVFEVRGHWENKTDSPDDSFSFVILPDKNPSYLINLSGDKTAPAPEKASSSEAASGGEEETISIAKADVEPGRWGSLLPAYGTYYAMYFTVTGLHALHIIGGLIVMLYFLGPGASLYRRNPEQLSNRIEVTGIFWHFVDLVWITVFPILYLT